MKKLLSLLLVLLLPTTLFAESAPPAATGDISGIYAEPYTSTEDFYVDVTLKFDQPDDTLREISLRVKAFTVTYQFEFLRDQGTDRLVGFRYDPETLVTLAPLTFEESEEPNFNKFMLECMDLTFASLELPTHFQVGQSHSDNYCWLEFSGGQFDVSYNDQIYFFCHDGSLDEYSQKTETFEYDFSNKEG